MPVLSEEPGIQEAANKSERRPLSFSVIIPAHNADRTLVETLDAVFRSTLQPDKVILVNDGSADDTVPLACAFPCEVVHVDIRQGPMQARFAGAECAAEDVLVFLDSDVRVKSDTFSRILLHFSQAGPDAVTGLLSAVPKLERDNFFTAFKNEYMNFIFRKQPSNSRFLYGSIWAIRRELLRPFQPISSPFGSLVADSELGMLLRRRGKKIVLDRCLEVDHLKHYDFLRLLKNDFTIPFLFSVMLFKYGWTSSSRRRGRFSHASIGQVLANSAALAAVACGAAAALAGRAAWLFGMAAAAGCVWIYWAKFLAVTARRRGGKFFFQALIFLLLDGAVMFCGMAAGFLFGLRDWLQRMFDSRIYIARLRNSSL